jgi:triacylglycerol lipase
LIASGLIALTPHCHSALAQSHAQAAPRPDAGQEAREGVAAIGREWNAAVYAETIRLYTAVHREIEWPGVLEPEVVAYGTDPQQTLRMFRPEQGFSEPGPVIFFVHGNGLGEASDTAPGSDSLIYSHVGKLGAQFGGIGITVSYRTGATGNGNSGPEDLRLALEWTQANVARYGGDANTIVLLACSDGATIAARYLFDESAQTESGPGIAVAFLISGLFGDEAHGLGRLVDRYDGVRVPLALWSAGYDTGRVQAGIAGLYAQLCRKYDGCPWFEQLQGHNHLSAILSLGTSDASAQNALIRFYHTVR